MPSKSPSGQIGSGADLGARDFLAAVAVGVICVATVYGLQAARPDARQDARQAEARHMIACLEAGEDEALCAWRWRAEQGRAGR